MATQQGARRTGSRGLTLSVHAIALVFMVFCVLPLLLIFAVSITDESSIQQNGYRFVPEVVSFQAYRAIFFGGDSILRSYRNSVFVVVIGTTSALVITAMAAFTLANRSIKSRNTLSLFFFVTMVFNAGIVPWYFMCQRLGLMNNFPALIVPRLLVNVFNLFLVRNFMSGIPQSLMESAEIDGASDLRTAFQIYFPLSTPVLAAVGLFYGLAYWNDWWNAIMLVEDRSLYPIQYLLFRMQSELQMLRELELVSTSSARPPAESAKMATAIITIGPIILLYPFLQRYFVKGLVVGAVKG